MLSLSVLLDSGLGGSEARHGNAVQTIDKCECHMARPTKLGFPLVRRDDWCSLHVDCYTGDRTFGGVAAQNFQ